MKYLLTMKTKAEADLIPSNKNLTKLNNISFHKTKKRYQLNFQMLSLRPRESLTLIQFYEFVKFKISISCGYLNNFI